MGKAVMMTGPKKSMKTREDFFFVKKKQKTFLIWATGVESGTDSDGQSFFCFFFVHKKEDSSLAYSDPSLIHPRVLQRFGFMAGQIAVPDDFNTMGRDAILDLFEHRG
jgi:hypothetical protein